MITSSRRLRTGFASPAVKVVDAARSTDFAAWGTMRRRRAHRDAQRQGRQRVGDLPHHRGRQQGARGGPQDRAEGVEGVVDGGDLVAQRSPARSPRRSSARALLDPRNAKESPSFSRSARARIPASSSGSQARIPAQAARAIAEGQAREAVGERRSRPWIEPRARGWGSQAPAARPYSRSLGPRLEAEGLDVLHAAAREARELHAAGVLVDLQERGGASRSSTSAHAWRPRRARPGSAAVASFTW